ncbi:succinate--hydroxymethylglutarate CoA-transferase isoform X2 [Brienomyrus brachyistius]|uniref:succinate--hydroxymethylglutarate CoA-transferase isoform X2 n=1 Tax=Brienomyrus brachyistius TaxID=42636 RepID=UPI0020B3F290|nr:succinate--hydroxymethylglutarate CoA-transferase isoform X2 [Brienomyrus brachyistius]
MAAVARSTVRLGPVYTVRIPWARSLCASTQPGKGVVKPLDGIRVLDLTRVLAGPFASMILGDLGAEVIKVERPGSGDDTRSWGPPFVGKESTYFLSINRNKKLAEVCDILMENYLPGKLGQMGLGYEDVQKVAPRLVYCSISGYGQSGPMSQSPGYDSIASAVSGMMHITGPEDGEPVRPGVAMTDLATGLYTHGAIMAGLLQQQKTGRGLHIDCNLLSSQVACLTHIAANYLNTGKEAKRWGTAHESIVPYQGFKTQDGYIVVAAGNNKQFAQVCEVLNLRCLSGDPKFKTNMLRVENRKELLMILAEKFSEKSTGEWLGKFAGTGVPCGPINNIQRVFSDPQVSHNNLILKMDHPTAGKIAVPGPAVQYSDFKSNMPTPPPLIGQHTVRVLRDLLGYRDDTIQQLLKAGTVSQNEVQ